ncbi:hypothetical protein V5O48_011382 [Marasmius crinis-equi]|uniref:Uncharacterized protein n=1 Tax=Marasmius crinis-equi TaxID=585013 RepID=A0ABR3F5Q4_9AGAR
MNVTRWVRVGLPNGQIARSRWKGELKPLNQLRMARNVEVKHNGQIHIAEIHFYAHLTLLDKDHFVAVGSFYGEPHPELYRQSNKTYITVQHAQDIDVRVVPIKSILSVVMMAPDPRYPLFFRDGTEKDRYFLMRRPGLKLAEMLGEQEEDVEI